MLPNDIIFFYSEPLSKYFWECLKYEISTLTPKVLLKSLINTRVKYLIHCHSVGRLHLNLWVNRRSLKLTSLCNHSLPSLPEREESPGDTHHLFRLWSLRSASKSVVRADFHPDFFINLSVLWQSWSYNGALVIRFILGSLAKMGWIHPYLQSNWETS